MVRLSGVDLPAEKNIVISLAYIYGIGPALAKTICAQTGINPLMKTRDLTDNQVVALREAIKEFPVEGDLRKDVTLNIKRLVEIGTYRGSRHRKGLPARGQRTKTNARTKRGKRLTVGLGKREKEKEEAKE